MTAIALDRFAEGATRGGLTAWLSLVVRSFTRPSLSEQERALLSGLRSAAATLGPPMLSATSRGDLEERIRDAAGEPSLLTLSADLTRHITLDLISAATALPEEPPPAMSGVLGAGPAKLLLQTGPLVAAAGSALAQAISAPGQRDLLAHHEALLLDGLLRDSEVPAAVKGCVLAGLESTAASLAVTHALLEGQRLDGWLALALVEEYRAGLYQSLRLLASLPDIHVPESIVPAQQRLDLAALDQQMHAAHARWDQLGDEAITAGGTLSLTDVPDDS